MISWKRMLLMAAVAPTLVLLAAGCDDSDDGGAEGTTNASQGAVDELSARVQRNEVLEATINIGNLPLHDMDEALAEGRVENNFIPDTTEAIRLLALTNWGPEFQPTADEVEAHAVALLQALDSDDVEGAAAPAHELHEGWHEFSEEIWAVLAADLPADAGGVAPHEEEADETPAAGETPAADESPSAKETPADGAEEEDDHSEEEAPDAEATP